MVAMLVLLQEPITALMPLKVTAPFPCVLPKLLPVIVTAVPTEPEAGVAVVIAGGGTIVNAVPLLDAPLTVTTIFPLLPPVGITAVMLDEFQAVTDAAVPFN